MGGAGRAAAAAAAAAAVAAPGAAAAAAAPCAPRSGYWRVLEIRNRQEVALVAAQGRAQDRVREIPGDDRRARNGWNSSLSAPLSSSCLASLLPLCSVLDELRRGVPCVLYPLKSPPPQRAQDSLPPAARTSPLFPERILSYLDVRSFARSPARCRLWSEYEYGWA